MGIVMPRKNFSLEIRARNHYLPSQNKSKGVWGHGNAIFSWQASKVCYTDFAITKYVGGLISV
jgi:hypothetical protein